MLSSMSDAVREYVWNVAEEEPERCPCRGHGWTLSPYDTWEKCPRHYRGQPDPESLLYEETNDT